MKYKNNVHSMLRNLNTLFDNYYRWGRNKEETIIKIIQNLDSTTRNSLNTNRNTSCL